MGRITQVKILQDFHTYDGSLARDLGPMFALDHAQGLVGYTIPALPAGTMLDFNAPIVVIVGKNGSGKSTLVSKLYATAGYLPVMRGMENLPHFMEVAYEGDRPPSLRSFFPGTKPSGALTLYGDGDSDSDRSSRELAKMSSGQYQWQQLQRFFKSLGANEGVVAFDQPEHDLDITAKPAMVGMICRYAQESGNQVIVATHEERFLRVHETHGIDALVISLLDTPARSYRMADFKLENYV